MHSKRLICAIQSSPLWCSPRHMNLAIPGENEYLDGIDTVWYFRTFRGSLVRPDALACQADYAANAGILVRSPNLAFDELWYRDRYPEVDELISRGDVACGWQHYIRDGAAKRLNPAAWFDEDWYEKQYPELRQSIRAGSILCGFEHFLLYGIYQDRSPSVYFNSSWYRRQYLSEHSERIPIVHYLFSRPEKRLSPVPFFDSDWYAKQYLTAVPEHPSRCWAPFEHYLLIGRRRAYSPSPLFNEMLYRDMYPEVVAKLENGTYLTGFEHYAREGVMNGFVASTHLDTSGADSSGPVFTRAYGQSLNLNISRIARLRRLMK